MPEAVHHEVAAGILVRDGRVLLCRRQEDRDWYPGAWDVVGGHREAGESMVAALYRECAEELGIRVRRAEHLLSVEEPGMTMSVFLVVDWAGEPSNAAPEEHAEVRWFGRDDLGGLAFPDRRLAQLLAAVLDDGP